MKTKTFLTIASLLALGIVVSYFATNGSDCAFLMWAFGIVGVGFLLISGVKVLQSWNDDMPTLHDGEN